LVRATSRAVRMLGATKLAATSAEAHISPYMPLRVCESAASLKASSAARSRSPGET